MPHLVHPQPAGVSLAHDRHRRSGMAVAVLVMAGVLPAAAQQPPATTPAGIVTEKQYQKLQSELAATRADRDAALKKADQAPAAQRPADARGASAEKHAPARPAGVPAEQLEALRKDRDTVRRERDATLAEIEDIKSQLAKARSDLALSTAAVRAATVQIKDDSAVRAERDRLKAELAAQEDSLAALRKDRDTARRERDATLAEIEDIKSQLAKARSDLALSTAAVRAATAATKEDAAVRAERDRLKAELAAQDDILAALRKQVAERDKRIAALPALKVQPAIVHQMGAPQPSSTTIINRQAASPSAADTTQTVHTYDYSTGTTNNFSSVGEAYSKVNNTTDYSSLYGPASRTTDYGSWNTTEPAVTLPVNSTELFVPNCGTACPSFIVIPYAGPATLGAGDEAITARFGYRFAMGKTEVTVAQWKAFWSAADRDYQPVKTDNTYCNWNDKWFANDDFNPVRCINLHDAQAYARWFSRRYGAQLGIRVESVGLPTELEWEYAARGGRNTQQYLWPDRADKGETCRHAQTNNCGSDLTVKRAGALLPNGYGLYDMIGNVWEWTDTDWRDDRKSMESNHRDEGKDGVAAARAVRGTAFGGKMIGLRLADRNTNVPSYRNDIFGFRLVIRIAP